LGKQDGIRILNTHIEENLAEIQLFLQFLPLYMIFLHIFEPKYAKIGELGQNRPAMPKQVSPGHNFF
jgi:hypothetical protein